jgi:acetoin:2,6-dichlorophenolindophenol oxidoreductase subunit alpha
MATETTLPVEQGRALEMVERMLRIRAFETQANQLYLSAKMPGLTHLYIGEEAVAVGVCSALRRDDTITSTHRGHGHCIAKGADVRLMYCELLGKEEGYCKGKGGSMHIADHANGNLGANAIVGGSAGIATGAGFSAKALGTDRVSVCFFGEGALGQGLLYEVMNMASLWKLPVIYVCENNLYGEYTHFTETNAGDLSARAAAFGIPVTHVDGQDIRATHEAAEKAVAQARAGEGPSFLLCDTYRYYGHHVGDIQRGYYRPREEEEMWRRDRDPIKIMAAWLESQGVATPAELDAIRQQVEADVAAGVKFALEAPYPELSEVDENVYA